MALADSAQLNKDFWDKLKPDESRVFLLFANKCLPKYIYFYSLLGEIYCQQSGENN